MNIKIYSTKININELLIGKIENISSALLSFFINNKINPKKIVSIELLTDIKNEDLDTTFRYFKELLDLVMKKAIPAYTVSPSHLIESKDGELIITCFNTDNQTIEYKEFQKLNYTTIQSPQSKTLISGGTHFNQGDDLFRNCQSSFDFMEQLLDKEELHFGHILDQSIKVGENYWKNTPVPSNPWSVIDQVKSFYFDPTLFKQAFSPLSLSQATTSGIFNQFCAGSNNSFPMHQDAITKKDNVSVNTAYISEWETIFFKTSSSTTNDNQNIITQCQNRIDLISESIKKHNNCQLTFLKVYLASHSDLNDAKLILTERWPNTNIIFINSDLVNSNALIELEGLFSING